MIVYRVECKTCNLGPYNCDCLSWLPYRDQLRSKHSTDAFLAKHPGMCMDFPQKQSYGGMENYYCGFRNIQQLLNWFQEDEIEDMNANDFTLSHYETDTAIEGFSRTQIFFWLGGRNTKLLNATEIPQCAASI